MAVPKPAAVRWYETGFALGAAGARPTQRKGRPRLAAMLPHWKQGIKDGAFAFRSFSHAYQYRDVWREEWPPMIKELMRGE